MPVSPAIVSARDTTIEPHRMGAGALA
jgi:hypothetical protein